MNPNEWTLDQCRDFLAECKGFRAVLPRFNVAGSSHPPNHRRDRGGVAGGLVLERNQPVLRRVVRRRTQAVRQPQCHAS